MIFNLVSIVKLLHDVGLGVQLSTNINHSLLVWSLNDSFILA
jgi:hypothetical protein